MLRSIPLSILLAVGLLFMVPARTRAEELQAASAARTVMRIIDTVLEHHIDAPTRQQMVLNVIRQIAAEEKKPPSPGLSKRISAADPESLETLLAQELSAYIKEGDSSSGFVSRAVGFSEFVAPGNLQIQTQEEYRVEQQIAGNRYVGIGVAAGMHQPTKQLKFMSVVPGGPAAAAGVKNGDIVETVDGEQTQGKPLLEVVHWLRGEEGTHVTITVRQPDEDKPREYTITRGVVPLTTVKQPAYSADKRVVAIGFERLSGSTVHELRKIEADLPETVEIVTFDFRNLAGGNLQHGIQIANALLDGKPIGQVESAGGIRTVTAEPGTLFGQRQLNIIINQTTRGIALWITAAVKDSVEGGIVYGHSNAQALVYEGVPIAETGFVVKMPTARLRRADGSRLSSLEPRQGDTIQGVTVTSAQQVLGRLLRQEKMDNIDLEPVLQLSSLKMIAEYIAGRHVQQQATPSKAEE